MREGRIEIDVEDGCIEAFVAWPGDLGQWPPVILLASWEGQAAALAGAARRLAAQGFFVLVPSAPDEPVEEAFDAWLDYLAGQRLADDVRVGVLGYGKGAGLAVQLAAAHGERIAAVAAFDPSGLPPESLRHLAECVNAVVHLGYSGHDDPGGEQGRASLAAELRRAGVDFEVEVYPARAGFAVPGDPHHSPRAADMHWKRLVELFRRTLPPPASGDASQPSAAPPMA